MFKTNEYFEGKVKSIAFNTSEGAATIGVMAIGEYEFGTSSIEIMTVTSGSMWIRFPESEEWKEFKQNETFTIASNKKFGVRTKEETSYFCLYK